MTEKANGKWELLTAWLLECGQDQVELTDDQIQVIVHSRDNRRPYPVADHPEYNITERANAAGYDVQCDPKYPKKKTFVKQSKGTISLSDSLLSDVVRAEKDEGGGLFGAGLGGVLGGFVGSVFGPVGTGVGAIIGAGMFGGTTRTIPDIPKDAILIERESPIVNAEKVKENLYFHYVGGVTRKIFNAGDEVPCFASLMCTTIHDNQNDFVIELRRGRKEKYEDNRLLATVTVSGMELAKAHTPQIKVSFYLKDQQLHLHVVNLNPQYEVKCVRSN